MKGATNLIYIEQCPYFCILKFLFKKKEGEEALQDLESLGAYAQKLNYERKLGSGAKAFE
jgi:hypothetical protein